MGMKHVTILWGAPSFWIERLPLYYGREKKIFQKRGVCPEVEIFHGGPELLRAVQEKRVQVGEIGLPPFMKAFSEGLPARIIGSTFIRRLDHFVAAQPGIRTVRELRGKRIGILSLGSCDEYFIRRLLQREGIDPDEGVELVPLGSAYGDLQCFVSGKIDAGFVVEPQLSLGESKGYCNVVVRVGDFSPRYQWGGIFAADVFIREHRDVLEALMEGYRESVQHIVADPDECTALGSRLFRLDPAVFRSALRRHLLDPEVEARIDPQGLENCARIQSEIGALPCGIRTSDMVLQM